MKIESQKLSAIELMIIMEDLMEKTKERDRFLTLEIENKCDEFYILCYNYLKKWNNSNQHVINLK